MTQDEIDFFDAIAPKWDAMERLSTSDRIDPILDIVGLKDGQHVLDLGTGTGVLLPYLRQRVGDDGRIVAVDFSTGMLNVARQKMRGVDDDILFEYLDFEESHIDGRFDVIFLYCVYPHLLEPVPTLKRLVSENLSENGKIIIAFPTDNHTINSIHKHRKLDDCLLVSAPVLAVNLRAAGLDAVCEADTESAYVVKVRGVLPHC